MTDTALFPTVPARALAIAAHPDDVELQCGATMAKWAAAGCVVDLLVLTDGSKGTWNPHVDIDALIRSRREEQDHAAAALGCTGDVVFLGQVDGELDSTFELRGQVAFWIRKLRPQIVLGHDPWKRYRLHPDHRHAGWLAVDAVVAARDPHFFKDHDVPHHRPDALWLFEADEPDHVEDVTGFAEAKIAALLEHRSQYESTLAINDSDTAADDEARFRARIIEDLVRVGARAGATHGEAFKVIEPL